MASGRDAPWLGGVDRSAGCRGLGGGLSVRIVLKVPRAHAGEEGSNGTPPMHCCTTGIAACVCLCAVSDGRWAFVSICTSGKSGTMQAAPILYHARTGLPRSPCNAASSSEPCLGREGAHGPGNAGATATVCRAQCACRCVQTDALAATLASRRMQQPLLPANRSSTATPATPS